MLNNFNSDDKIILTVDCVIFGFDVEGLKILLVRRDFESDIGKW
jgi:ADP-ribose pyrophosphatase YjhB (NUDIX family)